ncbi:MAG: B12-binding domain-containing radical SAM protein [Elusimicrobia bacterium]|nr:B12-binding domain-containing radical SAM protein [Elusimicrobiota bacterium]
MNILLVNPSYKSVYRDSKVKEGIPMSPVLSLAAIAANLRKSHNVKIFDANLFKNPYEELKNEIIRFSPAYVAITFTTPLYDEMRKISDMAKAINPKIITIGGGAHASGLPYDTLNNSSLDIIVVGEGDFTLAEIINGKGLGEIDGIFYKKDGKILKNSERTFVKDLDLLPFPAWDLFDIEKYAASELLARKTPAGWIETSRGCVFKCAYCNKSVFGNAFRTKSVKRVIEEMEYMLKLGFKEIHLADDAFTTDIKRAKEICREIIKRGLDFPWAPVTGIRIDGVDKELLELMKKAGCYRVYYGIESGNQKVLDGIGKGIKLDQIRKVVKISKEVGLEVFGFFMIALPGDTECSIRDTINFAKELDLDMAKMSVTIPLPATKLYEEWNKQGKIKMNVWSKFNLYSIPKDIFEHPNLAWPVIEKYYRKFYISFYFRPAFIVKYIIKSLKRGSLLHDIKCLLNTKW